jgi:vesicle transport through interaction with t-SNAREs 1
MSIFEAYDGEYSALTRDIIKKVQELKSSSGDKPQGQIRHIDGLFSQANDLIKQMEIEVRSHDPATRKALGEKVFEYKRALSSIRSDYERSKELAQRSSLVGEKSGEQRQRLLNANDK